MTRLQNDVDCITSTINCIWKWQTECFSQYWCSVASIPLLMLLCRLFQVMFKNSVEWITELQKVSRAWIPITSPSCPNHTCHTSGLQFSYYYSSRRWEPRRTSTLLIISFWGSTAPLSVKVDVLLGLAEFWIWLHLASTRPLPPLDTKDFISFPIWS